MILQYEEAPREATAQKTRTVLIVLQHEEAPREATARKTRTVLFVLQQDKGGPGQSGDVGAYSNTICTTDTREGGPGQSGDVGGGGGRRRRRGVGRENIQPPTDVGEKNRVQL